MRGSNRTSFNPQNLSRIYFDLDFLITYGLLS